MGGKFTFTELCFAVIAVTLVLMFLFGQNLLDA